MKVDVNTPSLKRYSTHVFDADDVDEADGNAVRSICSLTRSFGPFERMDADEAVNVEGLCGRCRQLLRARMD